LVIGFPEAEGRRLILVKGEFSGSGDSPNETRNLNQTESMIEAVTDPGLKTQSPFW
jgi:hypothetical protein